MENLAQEVKAFARREGANLVGIASASVFENERIRPSELLPGARSVIVLAMKILDGWFRLDALRGAGDVRFPLPRPEKPLRYRISREGWTASVLRPFDFVLAAADRRAATGASLPGVVLW